MKDEKVNLKLEKNKQLRMQKLIVKHDKLCDKLDKKLEKYVKTLPEHKRMLKMRKELAEIVAGSIQNDDLKEHILNHVSGVLSGDLDLNDSEKLAKEYLNEK